MHNPKRRTHSILHVQIMRRDYDSSGLIDIISIFSETFRSNRDAIRACKATAEIVSMLKADEANTDKQVSLQGGNHAH